MPQAQKIIKIYTPESSISHPGRLISELFQGFKEGRFLARRLYIRNVRAQYRQSLLGFFWAFLPPLASGLVWIFLKDQQVFGIGETVIPYPVFVLTGTILWQVFLDSINIPMGTINGSKAMMSKINFPPEALILTSFYQLLSNFGIKLVLLIGVYIWFGFLPAPQVVYSFGAVLVMIIFGGSLSLLLTPLSMLYGDIKRIITLALSFLFFLTPIIYPKPQEGVAEVVAEVNPVAHLLSAARDWLTLGEIDNMNAFWIVAGSSVLMLIFGLIFLKVSLPHLVERIGS